MCGDGVPRNRPLRLMTPTVKRKETAVAQQILFIALAGAAGTLARWGLSAAVYRLAGGAFPFGTLAVNVLGSFLFGIIWVLGEQRGILSPGVRLVILVGFMGAFTTFSTFAFETDALLRTGRYWTAAVSVLLQNGAGVAAVVLGLAAGRAGFCPVVPQ